MKRQLSTDEGQTRKGDVYLLLAFIQPIVYSMSPGWGQVIVGSLALLTLALLSYRTVGNIPPEQAKEVRDLLETDTVQDVLRQGRE